MGQHDVSESEDDEQRRTFVRALLEDVRALEMMLDQGRFESGVRRIGAEQEMFLVDEGMNPAPVAMDVLERAGDERLTTELARFNLEANLSPQVYGGNCLAQMEKELIEVLEVSRRAAQAAGADILLTGILPTLTMGDLGLDNMTPNPRYYALNRAMASHRNGAFHVLIKGVDELETSHDNVMLESCNTSFQVHFQVGPEEFARLYNVAQAITAPVLAAAVNSPVLLQHRLWHETRVALFQRSVDVRNPAHQARGMRPRVSFGDAWIRDSVLEIFREDIARFRVLLGDDIEERSMEVVEQGGVPQLAALRLHNGTVYRWNRACYGIGGGQAHLRIENRVLPSGPTVSDEIANAAFFFGLMSRFTEEYDDVAKVMEFDDAKRNFFAAARQGLDAQFRWIGGRSVTAQSLILDELLPMAREGLTSAGIRVSDIERYLGIIEQRVATGRTGAWWMLASLSEMGTESPADLRHRHLATALLKHQDLPQGGEPVHTWEPTRLPVDSEWKHAYRTVGQFMTTSVLTVRPEDLVDLAASLMDWEKIRHVPVEDEQGRLVGLVSHRQLLRMVARGHLSGDKQQVAVRDIMRPDPVTVTKATKTVDAMRAMREHGVGSLPVVEDGKLVGIVTERDLIDVSARLLERYLEE